MGKIGNWGSELTFNVNSDEHLTFRNLEEEAGARWATHEIILGDVRGEFLGPEQGSITLEVVISAEWGHNPYDVIRTLHKACKKGVTNWLYIGGKRVGECKWYLERVSAAWDQVWSRGELVRATTKLTFKEFH